MFASYSKLGEDEGWCAHAHRLGEAACQACGDASLQDFLSLQIEDIKVVGYA